MKPKFQIGDRVVNLPSVMDDSYSYPEWFVGLHGTICCVYHEFGVNEYGELYGIDYDDDLNSFDAGAYIGHTCDGHARRGHGRNIRGVFLCPEEELISIDISALL